jgi:hypothetical protein
VTWKPGQSGNPRGRAKLDAATLELRDLARAHGPDAIERLAEIMNSKESDPRAVISACDLLLQRGFGRVLPVGADLETEGQEDDGMELVEAMSRDDHGRRLLDDIAAAQARLARDPGVVR